MRCRAVMIYKNLALAFAALVFAGDAQAEDASMSTFLRAKADIEEFAEVLGVYSACREVAEAAKQSGTTGTAAGTIKALYQATSTPQDLKLRYISALEETGFSFDQMVRLDDILTRVSDARYVDTQEMMAVTSADQVVHACSVARGNITRF